MNCRHHCARLNAGAVMADVTSANIVGYAGSDLTEGHTAFSPQFANVGASSVISLDSFKPTGNVGSDEVIIEVLNSIGVATASYYWINWGGETGDVECWSPDGSGDVAEGVTFPVGQGLWVIGANNEQVLQTSGEVLTSDVSVQLTEGHTLTGNPFPVELPLNDIVPTGNVGSDEVIIEVLNSIGVATASYYWINWGGETGDVECWSPDGSGDVAEGVTFPVGQGLWVIGANDEQYLQFSAPEL